MEPYRIYLLDLTGKILGPPVDIAFRNDLEALENARETLATHTGGIEIWQGRRLVSWT